MRSATLPAPALPQLMEALLELEAGAAGPAALALATDALRAGLPRVGASDYLVEVVRVAKELRTALRAVPPDFDLTVALLAPDQALAYLYEVEQTKGGFMGAVLDQAWSGLSSEDRAHLTATTLSAARAIRDHWQAQLGPLLWRLTPIPA